MSGIVRLRPRLAEYWSTSASWSCSIASSPAIERRIKAAKFPVSKSLETFELTAIPSLNKRLVLELTRSEYLDRRESVVALGNSGTGKTHCALALGLAACQKGYRVRFTTAAALVNELLEARDRARSQVSERKRSEHRNFTPPAEARPQETTGQSVSVLDVSGGRRVNCESR